MTDSRKDEKKDDSSIEAARASYAKQYSIYLSNNNFDAIIENAKKMLEKDPRFVQAFSNRAFAYAKKDMSLESIADWSHCIGVSDNKNHIIIFHYNRGLEYGKIKDYPMFLLDYDKSIDYQPPAKGLIHFLNLLDKKDTLNMISEIQSDTVRINILNKCLDKNHLFGKRCADLQITPDEIQSLISQSKNSKILKINNSKEASDAAENFMVKKDFARAAAYLTRAIELDPSDATLYFKRGLAHSANNMPARANADFSFCEAIEHTPGSSFDRICNEALNNENFDLVIAYTTEMLKRDPGNSRANHYREESQGFDELFSKQKKSQTKQEAPRKYTTHTSSLWKDSEEQASTERDSLPEITPTQKKSGGKPPS